MFKLRFKSKTEQEKLPLADYGAAKRRAPVLLWVIILLVVASPFFYFILMALSDKLLVRAGGFITTPKIMVRTDQTGKLVETFVKVGVQVEKNQPLMQLTNQNLLLLEQSLARKQKILQLYDKTRINADYFPDMQKQLQSSIQFFYKNYMAILQLQREGAASAAEVEQAHNNYLLAKEKLLSNQTEAMQQHRDEAREWQLDIAEKKEELIKDQQLLDLEKQNLQIKAPVAGVIKELMIYPQSFVKVGTPMLLMSVPTEFHIEAYLEPKFAKYAVVNKKVTVRFPDGEKVLGVVQQQPEITRLLPPEMIGAFGIRTTQLLVRITTFDPIPKKYQIDGVPVKIRFHFFD